MRRVLFKNITLYLAINLAIKCFWVLVVEAMVQNSLGTAAFGSYQAVYNLSLIMSAIMDLGITNAYNRETARSPAEASTMFLYIRRFKLAGSIIYLLSTLFLAKIIGFNKEELLLLWPLMGIQMAVSWTLLFRGVFGGMHLFHTDRWFSVADRIIIMILLGLFIVGLDSRFRLTSFTYGIIQMIGTGATALLAAMIYRGVRPLSSLSTNEDKNWSYRDLLALGGPYFLVAMLTLAYTRIDTIILQRILPHGDYEAGVYSACYRLYEAMNQIILLIAVVLFPYFAKSGSGHADNMKIIRWAALLLFWIICPVCMLIFIWRNELLGAIYTYLDPRSGQLMGLLLVAFIPASISYIFGAYLMAMHQMRQIIWAAGWGLVINLAANFFLIPHWQVLGTGVAIIFTQIWVLSFFIYFTYLHAGIRFPSFQTAKGIASVLLLITGIWGVSGLISSLWLQTLATVLIWAAICGIFYTREMKDFIVLHSPITSPSA